MAIIQHKKTKKIKLTFNGEDTKIIDLADIMDAQLIDLQYIHYDISTPVDISVEVIETYAGNISNDIYVADIQFGISSNIPSGR